MDLGVVLQTTPPSARVIDLAKKAEAYGFTHVWTFDSHILWQEPYVIYSQILAETRNIVVGPSLFTADLGLHKSFAVFGEGKRLEFRAEAFNVLNHTNFRQPNGNRSSIAYGTIRSAFPARLGPSDRARRYVSSFERVSGRGATAEPAGVSAAFKRVSGRG